MEDLPFPIPWCGGHHAARWDFLSSFLASYFLIFCGSSFLCSVNDTILNYEEPPSDLWFSEAAPLVLSWLELCPFQWFRAVKWLLSLLSEAVGTSQDKSGRAVERRWFLASIILSSKFYFWVALQLPPSVKEKDAQFHVFYYVFPSIFSA